ncbi:diguanylate cyclase [Bradyrhizobium genosp. P]|uniref:diguanylate cyclase n=1 Tax=Bradyrhizobium genosp. P TaxID=83641 RepID=UPI003CF4838F
MHEMQDPEARRLDVLAHLDILDTPRELAFDRLTALCRKIFRVPMSTFASRTMSSCATSRSSVSMRARSFAYQAQSSGRCARWIRAPATSTPDLAAIAVDELMLRNLSMQDSLTCTSSRRCFRGEGERLTALAARHLSPLACAVLDVDHFKSVNDSYGHAVGDGAVRGRGRRAE